MSFTIEEVLYLYSFISISLIIYNTKYMFLKIRNENKNNNLKEKYLKEYNMIIYSLKENTYFYIVYHKRLVKELKKINSILAFNEAINLKKYSEDFKLYRTFIYNVLLDVSKDYDAKSNMEKALFVYIIGNLNIYIDNDYRLDNKIISYLNNPSVYLVENSINTFVLLGHKDSLIKILNLLNLKDIYHNEKLLSDALLKYNGNKIQLAKELWKYRYKWNEKYIKAIIKFITNMKFDFKEEFYNELTNENLTNEVLIELIRYFGKVRYDKVLDLILDILEIKDNTDINLRIVIVSILGKYPYKRVINALKRQMKSSNWYVRNNACLSFLELNPEKVDIDYILKGKDKYAKDILIYQLEKRG